MSENCICYTGMSVEDMNNLPDERKAEAITGTIPVKFQQTDYLEVLRRAAISPGNMDKLKELLLENEKKSKLSESELAAIKKIHSSNLYYTENAIIDSLHQIIKNKLLDRSSEELKMIKIVIENGIAGDEKQWQDVIKEGMSEQLHFDRNYSIDDMDRFLSKFLTAVELFDLSREYFKMRMTEVIQEEKKMVPHYCIVAANRFGIGIDANEYVKTADDLIRSANTENDKEKRHNLARIAVEVYKALIDRKYLAGNRSNIIDQCEKHSSQSAIRTASKLLNFTYIPRGFWDRIFS